MKNPYWQYETCIGENMVVSIRMNSPTSNTIYQRFLAKFIIYYETRITIIEDTIKLYDGSLCTIIRLSGIQPLNYPAQILTQIFPYFQVKI